MLQDTALSLGDDKMEKLSLHLWNTEVSTSSMPVMLRMASGPWKNCMWLRQCHSYYCSIHLLLMTQPTLTDSRLAGPCLNWILSFSNMNKLWTAHSHLHPHWFILTLHILLESKMLMEHYIRVTQAKLYSSEECYDDCYHSWFLAKSMSTLTIIAIKYMIYLANHNLFPVLATTNFLLLSYFSLSQNDNSKWLPTRSQ